MKIEIVARPEFCLPLSPAVVDLCIKLSKTHYDAVCRAAGMPCEVHGGRLQPAGFLAVWKQQLDCALEHSPADPLPTLNGSWRQMDTLLKILENTYGCRDEELKTAWGLSFAIRGALRTANALIDTWKGEYVHAPTDAVKN